MGKQIICFCVVFLSVALSALCDDQVRQVQEELRKRNLYFGDIDGKFSPDLANALKRYQDRKGFSVSGAIDQMTAVSLNVRSPAVAALSQSLPEMPVLRSDSARELDDTQRQQLDRMGEENPDAVPTPAPPAEEPPPSQDLKPERITELVQQYLRDAETDDIAAQTRYFAYPVEYFDHGSRDPAFVTKDVVNYCRHWPTRKYSLTQPVTFAASANEGETIVEFPIAFSVRNKKHAAAGKTKNTWVVRPDGDELKIIAIREERLRD